MAGTPRSYGQRCGLAFSLDLLGERWTLLILRELSRGPKRFKDLLENLQGIGPNLLSSRLKSLEQAGVFQKVTLPPPVSAPAYELTDRGWELQPILEDLALWGFGLMPPPDQTGDLTTRASWAAMTMKATMDRDPALPPHGIYGFSVDGEEFWLSVRDSGSDLRDGVPPIDADANLRIGLDDFLSVASGKITIEDSSAVVEGDSDRLYSLLETFRIPTERALS